MKPDTSYTQQPIRSMQKMLRVIAYEQKKSLVLTPDGVYGPNTVAAITSFQQQHGLPATGITNQETWDTIADTYETAKNNILDAQSIDPIIGCSNIFTMGCEDPAIMLAQCMLFYIGKKYSCVNIPDVTGILDQSTADALSSFQILNGLSATGNLDKTTWKHLALHFPSTCYKSNNT